MLIIIPTLNVQDNFFFFGVINLLSFLLFFLCGHYLVSQCYGVLFYFILNYYLFFYCSYVGTVFTILVAQYYVICYSF